MSVKDIAPYKGKRRKLLEFMLTPEACDLSNLEIGRRLDISQESIYKYLKEPEFCNALKQECVKIYTRHLPSTINSVIKASRRGDIKAASLLHEVLELSGKRALQQVNIGVQQVQDRQERQFANDDELRAYIAQVRIELDALEKTITARKLLGDGIHLEPVAAGGGEGEDGKSS